MSNKKQCTIPAFDGLFPDKYDASISILLFRMAEWHSLAKLRLHSDNSLHLLDQSLKRLSAQFRHFVNITCAAFETKELPGEVVIWQRRQQAEQEKKNRTNTSSPSGPHIKRINIHTYKFHALGDYTNTIKLFGTTDSYTTQVVSGACIRIVLIVLCWCSLA